LKGKIRRDEENGMHDWMINGWGMGFGFIFWLLVLALLVGGVVWFVRSQAAVEGRSQQRRSAGLDVLEERYARGEINREEYLQKKRDLTEQI
jgi:putative membrane protein